MQLSKADLLLLSNFSTINQAMRFIPGTTQRTKSDSGNIFAFAEFSVDFPKEFCVFDLNHFISVISLVSSTGDVELHFPEDAEHLMIRSEKTEQGIRFADSEIVAEFDNSKEYDIKNPDVTFTLTESMLEYGKKSAAINGYQHLMFGGDENEIFMVSNDFSNPSAERHKRTLEQKNNSGEAFEAIFDVAKLKMIPDDYEVKISLKGGAQFTSKNRDYRYFSVIENPVNHTN